MKFACQSIPLKAFKLLTIVELNSSDGGSGG